jgi:hypothetical protein
MIRKLICLLRGHLWDEPTGVCTRCGAKIGDYGHG